MKIFFFAATVLGLLPAMAIAGPSQFDLVCEGVFSQPPLPLHEHFSVDLDAGKWCGRRCGSIVEVTPDRLVFSALDVHGHGQDIWVDRRSGVLTDVYRDGRIVDARTAKCESAAFTPFPETKF